MLDLLFQLRRALVQRQIDPAAIKITIEFTTPEAQARSEMEAQRFATFDMNIDWETVRCAVDGQPFSILGFNFQVKKFEYPKPPDCMCPECVGLRNFRRDAADK